MSQNNPKVNEYREIKQLLKKLSLQPVKVDEIYTKRIQRQVFGCMKLIATRLGAKVDDIHFS